MQTKNKSIITAIAVLALAASGFAAWTILGFSATGLITASSTSPTLNCTSDIRNMDVTTDTAGQQGFTISCTNPDGPASYTYNYAADIQDVPGDGCNNAGDFTVTSTTPNNTTVAWASHETRVDQINVTWVAHACPQTVNLTAAWNTAA